MNTIFLFFSLRHTSALGGVRRYRSATL